MNGRGGPADGELVGRTLCEIAHVLESAQDARVRVRAALEFLGDVVPFDQCAILEADAGADARLLAFPEMPAGAKSELTHTLLQLFGKMLEERAVAPAPSGRAPQAHLAVPLIGLDEVIGVLFVRRNEGSYEKGNLRVLSLVAAQIAAYLTMLRARAEETSHATELETARRVADAALQARNELVNLVAQELKTPLAAAMAWVRVLGKEDLPAEERARALKAIDRGARRHTRLIGDLLGLASVYPRPLQLDRRAVELAKCVEAAVHIVRPLAEIRSIRLDASLEAPVRPILADAERIEEVFDILLANAFEFTPDSGSIHIRLEPTTSGARVQVIDSGAPIAPDHLARVFDRHADGERPTIRRYSGLATARRLVEFHGGTIRADNVGDDAGAAFTVELPAA